MALRFYIFFFANFMWSSSQFSFLFFSFQHILVTLNSICYGFVSIPSSHLRRIGTYRNHLCDRFIYFSFVIIFFVTFTCLDDNDVKFIVFFFFFSCDSSRAFGSICWAYFSFSKIVRIKNEIENNGERAEPLTSSWCFVYMYAWRVMKGPAAGWNCCNLISNAGFAQFDTQIISEA